ncbi:hypothetical protein GYMLUDRAFT_72298 [Collybiopsis luxurians FD-317 M1]|uniref:LsmAD domain-containing protein n=1 Tax=Collybiopsis luxurians FD-317 M1 TaxID=944289 RepID=A0A0D0CU95_9AGAR|nr:hypothetical protein GYMLUDRAFT_72298 [Collybiopsis luxurians FD-317 M1]
MASGNRTKAQRKGAPGSAGRAPAWSGARASPTFSPSSSSPRPNQSSFPPLAQQNGNRFDSPPDRVLQSLSGLTGTTITLITKSALRYEGVVSLTSNEGETPGVTLKDVKELTTPGAPIKDQLFIASANIDTWSSGPADAKFTNGDTFRTDADIGQKRTGGGEKELQAWQAPSDVPLPTESSQFARGDDVTFGPGSNGNTSWDQFAANEKLFGVKATYDEDVYTTKLDRNHPEFKERAREAQKIADEILGATASNPHIAEERNQANDDSGVNEEDKYGAVVRGSNAYVPPGARKAAAAAVVAVGPNSAAKPDIPQVSVNGPDGAAISSQSKSPASSSKAPSPAPNKFDQPADALPALREFVANEKQRLTEKRQALAKSEMDKRMADLVKFSQSFKLNKPIPEDLVSILAKDEEKQKQIREKSSKDASSAQARNIGASIAAVPTRGPHITTAKVVEAGRKPAAPAAAAGKTATQAAGTGVSAQKPNTTKTETTKPAKPVMFIQAIPPFKGSKRQSLQQPASTTNGGLNGASATTAQPPASAKPTPAAANSAAAAAKLNANAMSFRPNPKASAFTPGAPSPGPSTSNNSVSSSVSPKPKETQGPAPPNPFFGTRPIKKSPPVNVKDDFNPFKHAKVVDASGITALWPYSGKRYMQMYPTQQHPPQAPHMVAPPPTMPPPPPYEEDPNQRAATGGYVYYAPTYYPGQPMMPGMAPPGPPGTFMPPYMQPMHYPPGMPPNAMYAPPMGQMPPYMSAPPPGSYPPPPNGAAGPRPSMPPTPIPAHAHPYYHQSPQLQHAVPYPMMMPPPPGSVPPHPYDGSQAPPVQMGGHA